MYFSDSPQVAQVYVHGSRLPLFDASGRQIITATAAAEPPPAHRTVSALPFSSPVAPVVVAATAGENVVVQQQQQQPVQQQIQIPPSSVVVPTTHMHPNKVQLELHRERELLQKREREKELRTSIPGTTLFTIYIKIVLLIFFLFSASRSCSNAKSQQSCTTPIRSSHPAN